MPRYEKDGRAAIETSLPREGVQLRAEGWREVKARTTAVREADAERVTDEPEATVAEKPAVVDAPDEDAPKPTEPKKSRTNK